MAVTISVALLILRLMLGLTLAVHGADKLFGWFGGSGFAKTTQVMQAHGFKPASFWAGLGALGELGGGLSLVLGFLTPLGAAGIFAAMLMAVVRFHWKNGFWLQKGGYEYALSLLIVSIAIGLIGPGSYSLDALFGIALLETLLFVVLAVAALLVDAVGLIISRPAKITTSEGMSKAS